MNGDDVARGVHRVMIWPIWIQRRLARLRPMVLPQDVTGVEYRRFPYRHLIVWSGRYAQHVHVPFWVRERAARDWAEQWNRK